MTIDFLGDSITFGIGASCEENCFVNLVKNALNCKVNNYGISGTRIAHNRKKSVNSDFDNDFLMRAPALDKSADYVFVFGGTNDFGHGDAPLGDLNSFDEFTFCGAVNSLIKTLSEMFDKRKIAFILPMRRYNEQSTCGDVGMKEENSPVLAQYVNALKCVLDKNNIPYIDLFNHSVLKTPVQGESLFFADGLHPSDAGHAVIAQSVVSFIEAMEFYNKQD